MEKKTLFITIGAYVADRAHTTATNSIPCYAKQS